jgi:hypothetical protein
MVRSPSVRVERERSTSPPAVVRVESGGVLFGTGSAP